MSDGELVWCRWRCVYVGEGRHDARRQEARALSDIVDIYAVLYVKL